MVAKPASRELGWMLFEVAGLLVLRERPSTRACLPCTARGDRPLSVSQAPFPSSPRAQHVDRP